MPLHPQAERLLAAMALFGKPLVESTPAEARTMRAANPRPEPEHVHEVRDVDADGVPARLYRPSADTGLGLLIYLHGGGWVIGDLDSHDNVCRAIANRSGHAVLSIDYRLAPEHPFPAALDDSITATRWAHTHASDLGCDPARLAIGGDSAGGNLSAVVANLAVVPLRFQLLVYPVTDARCDAPSYVENGEGYFLTAASMQWFIGHYLSGDASALDDPRLSPLRADDEAVRNSPPTLVITAEFDPLRDEGDRYAARLASLGVPTSHVRFGGMFHGFFSMGEFLDDGRTAVALAAEAVKVALDRS
ncbi:MAG: esterase [Ilumatobacteraceae bacterium]|nr:esterase [Ilumatobacteraceae bacterium]